MADIYPASLWSVWGTCCEWLMVRWWVRDFNNGLENDSRADRPSVGNEEMIGQLEEKVHHGRQSHHLATLPVSPTNFTVSSLRVSDRLARRNFCPRWVLKKNIQCNRQALLWPFVQDTLTMVVTSWASSTPIVGPLRKKELCRYRVNFTCVKMMTDLNKLIEK